ncbi:MAG: biotin-dependent carboxyltransferase family protein, partial [Chloroflexota bacterium]
GAVDPDAFAAANLLVGNDADAAAVEMTLVGPTLLVRERVTIGLAGGDLGGIAQPGGRRLVPGAAYRLSAGTTISFAGRVSGGARGYLALPGGVDAPPVLGSRSTCLAAGFGGLEGRRLEAGDIIRAATPDMARPELRLPDADATPAAAVVRIVAQRDADRDDHEALDALVSAPWSVAPDSDRMGLRLTGPTIRTSADTVVSHGVTWGTIQLPPGGAPIVLLADHQPTGGYPVVAVAIAADRGILGAIGPGDEVRFTEATLEEAVRALRAKHAERAALRETLAAAARALRDDERWSDLSEWAGG